ncbi:hypothetical protein [Mycobacterium marinum]|uniref:hypothetical protein n=1 Tax=Mycobacterium marinum TaxID=1781 RepID=UPI00235953D9|nr:hypothetical protein [Mycobacterium marinum]MDC8981255.1 hypothetical protein [Mycobacterium marinum]
MTTNDKNQLSPAGQRWLARPTTDVGPATPPPPWCAPDTMPEWDRLSDEYGGGSECGWYRYFPNNDGVTADVWIRAYDRIEAGRVMRSAPEIHYSEPTDRGVTPAEARKLAAELLNAADVLDEQR